MWLWFNSYLDLYDESRRMIRELFPQEVIYPKKFKGFIDNRRIGDGILFQAKIQEHSTKS